MKIDEMDLPQLAEAMKGYEINHPNSDSRYWQRAFHLAKASGMKDLDMGCRTCWTKVIEFMDNAMKK